MLSRNCKFCKKSFISINGSILCSEKCKKERASQQRKNAREKIKSNPELLKKKREYEKQWRKKNKNNYQKNLKTFSPGYKEYRKEYFKQWRQKNKDHIQEYQKSLSPEYKEKKKEADKQWKQKNKDRYRQLTREWGKNRRKEDLYFTLTALLRNQLNQKLKPKKVSKKNNKALELLGIEIKYFKKYLERKFKPGMTWENRGKVWHIDHIIPVSILDISKEENLKFAFHYRNLQPMFAKDNIRKSNKIFVAAEKGDKFRDMDVKIKNILKRVHPEQELDFNIIRKPIYERGIGVEIIFKRTIN